jgi:hypothetical protein
MHTLGGGAPDLLVGFRGQNFTLEVKDGTKAPSDRKLTLAEVEWVSTWRGQVAVVCSIDDALAVLGVQDAQALDDVPDVPDMVGDYWRNLTATEHRAACPKCGLPDLEVRTTVDRGKRWFYLLCCGSVQPLGVPGRVGA